MTDRGCILESLAAQAQRPGFKDAAGLVMLELLHNHGAIALAGLATVLRVGERGQCSCRCGTASAKAALARPHEHGVPCPTCARSPYCL